MAPNLKEFVLLSRININKVDSFIASWFRDGESQLMEEGGYKIEGKLFKLIKQKIDKKGIDLFSIDNLYMELISKKNQISAKEVARLLEENDLLFKINSRQFINFEIIKDLLNDKEKDELKGLVKDVEEFIKNNFFVLEIDREIINKQLAEIFSEEHISDDNNSADEAIDKEDFFSELRIANDLNKELGIEVDNEILFYKLLSFKDVYYENGELFKSENVKLEILLFKIVILFKKFKELDLNYKLDDILKCLFASKKSLKVQEIKSYLDILFGSIYKLEDIILTLKDNSNFVEIDHQRWIDKRYYLKNYIEFSGNFKKDLKKILDNLSDREREIFKRRIFISYEKQDTLEDIGQDFAVTRERIRQIESRLKRKLYHIKYKGNYIRYFRILEKVFKNNRVISLDRLIKHPLFKNNFSEVNLESFISFYNQYNDQASGKEIMIINNDYLLFLEKDKYDFLWQRAKKELIDDEGLINFDELVDFFNKFQIKNTEFIKSKVNKSDNMLKVENKVLFKEGSIYTSDKVRMLLSLEGDPLHYKEITKLYNKYFEKAKARNIHTKLDYYDQFIRVDSGTFGLASWGCEEDIYVRDLNCRILKESKRPMHHKEITKKVKEIKDVTDATVYAFLCDNDKIFNYSAGRFALKEWQEDKVIAEKYNISSWRIKATEEDRTYSCFLGSCLGRNDRLISLHKISESYFNNRSISISDKLTDKLKIKNEVIAVDAKGKVYKFKFNQNFKELYLTKRIFEVNQIEIGDIIYFEYYSGEVIRVHKQDDYEKKYQVIAKEELEVEEADDQAVDKLMKIIFGEGTDKIDSLKSAKEFGLKNGYVKFKDLIDLDYQQEDIADHFEAIQVLDESNIEIIYD